MDIVKAMNEMSLWTDSPVQHIQVLDPPFGKFRFAASHLGKVILGILCIGKYHNHIFDRKIPLLFALNPYCPDFLVLKQLYFLYIRCILRNA